MYILVLAVGFLCSPVCASLFVADARLGISLLGWIPASLLRAGVWSPLCCCGGPWWIGSRIGGDRSRFNKRKVSSVDGIGLFFSFGFAVYGHGGRKRELMEGGGRAALVFPAICLGVVLWWFGGRLRLSLQLQLEVAWTGWQELGDGSPPMLVQRDRKSVV